MTISSIDTDKYVIAYIAKDTDKYISAYIAKDTYTHFIVS